MAARSVRYVAIQVSSRAGQGAAVLEAVAKARINLLAFTGFPDRAGRSQIDLVTEEVAKLGKLARAEGWRLSAVKRGFLIQGRDRVGAVHRQLARLAKAGINVTAVDAVTAGRGRFGMILCVKPRDHARAKKALRAR
ncbi:MAG: hypothetical protein ACREI8_13575 [Myxococcota bacterium]